MQRAPGIRARAAFTLIELLAVIAIIGILVSLSLVAIVPLIRKGPEAQTSYELRGLAAALAKFKEKFGFYPPSKILLSNKFLTYKNSDPVSWSYLQTMWRHLELEKPGNVVDWSGGAGLPDAGIYLEGDQCLVFFLGGIPDLATGAPLGFSTDPYNPTKLSGDRYKFFEFTSGNTKRLRSGNPFPSMVDHWGADKPYLFFSGGKEGRHWGPHCPSFMPPSGPSPGIGWPYFESVGTGVRYHEKFQIISAGQNGKFGPGGPWSPGTIGDMADGGDDQVSFYGSKLSVPAQ